ncbi:MAG: Uncharacterised protein [SAR116 cluster bacterium]|nr:MAG: Uncharacterised protein [SAR116 cluster bacterium]
MAPEDMIQPGTLPPDGGAQTGLMATTLDSRYTQTSGRVFLNGTQALVRLMLDQARRDAAAGLSTGGMASGYRGSPLAALDQELWRANRHLDAHAIEFIPAVNEDMAATIISGTQQAEGQPATTVDGVFSLWYGKGPGVDRSIDAIKHGNAYGSSPHGGVLMVAGDDHGCVSSTIAHQSELSLMSASVPVIHPASIADILSFGMFGFALSRYSGLWAGFKTASELIEAGQTVDLPSLPTFVLPPLSDMADGLHVRWPDAPGLHLEERMQAKLAAAGQFAAANSIDRVICGTKQARLGIITVGKAHGDLMEALRFMGMDAAACRQHGVDIYKIGLVWPVEETGAMAFMEGKAEILVVEEKRGIVEEQIRAIATRMGSRAPTRITGKTGATNMPFVPTAGELAPTALIPLLAERLDAHCDGADFGGRAAALTATQHRANMPPFSQRTPHFCSGCPHNTSTRVPEGSEALAGIGCHFMATIMDRNTKYICQMGGEGANWVGTSRFNGNKHIFQNIGDGTWVHSGSMAIRQAVAAKTAITFKLLFNDAVAMTGGQAVDGEISPASIAHICAAEGVRRIALVSDDITAVARGDYPALTSFHDRAEMDSLQRDLREFSDVSVLIYLQTCAAEKRRRRKRGTLADPARHVVINEAVCEGCGDCSIASNCLSVEPLETPLGRKRRINLSSCNKDFTCLDGFCPSFVTVEGDRLTRDAVMPDFSAAIAALPAPAPAPVDAPYDILVTGVGGTGVVTVGAVLSMAAHLDGTATSLLNFSGLAQKFGAVMSFVRLAGDPDKLHQTRIASGAADALIGCDAVVSASPTAMATYKQGTRAVINLAEMTTGEIIGKRDLDLQIDDRLTAIAAATGSRTIEGFNANYVAEAVLGDVVYANIMMLGAAWQQGVVPVSLEALYRAIELNGVKPDMNRLAFMVGRLMIASPEAVTDALVPASTDNPVPQDYSQILAHRESLLAAYQNAAYAALYRARMDDFAARCDDETLRCIVARQLYRVMAYKDEYEVARLHARVEFAGTLASQFAPGYRVVNHMVVPFLTRKTDARGRPQKTPMRFIRHLFPLLARGKVLRGTRFDPFGMQHDRKAERALIDWYLGLMADFDPQADRAAWHDILGAAADIRGFGPVKMAAMEKVQASVARQRAALGQA